MNQKKSQSKPGFKEKLILSWKNNLSIVFWEVTFAVVVYFLAQTVVIIIMSKVMPTADRAVGEYAIFSVSGMAFGMAAMALVKLAYAYKRTGEPIYRSRIAATIISVAVLEICVFGGAIAVLFEAREYVTQLSLYGMSQMAAEPSYWIGWTVIVQMVAGHVYAAIVARPCSNLDA